MQPVTTTTKHDGIYVGNALQVTEDNIEDVAGYVIRRGLCKAFVDSWEGGQVLYLSRGPSSAEMYSAVPAGLWVIFVPNKSIGWIACSNNRFHSVYCTSGNSSPDRRER